MLCLVSISFIQYFRVYHPKDFFKFYDEVLKKVDLFEDKAKKYHKFSLGIKQKLGIAQVLMENS